MKILRYGVLVTLCLCCGCSIIKDIALGMVSSSTPDITAQVGAENTNQTVGLTNKVDKSTEQDSNQDTTQKINNKVVSDLSNKGGTVGTVGAVDTSSNTLTSSTTRNQSISDTSTKKNNLNISDLRAETVNIHTDRNELILLTIMLIMAVSAGIFAYYITSAMTKD